ncbi:hypothetical protein HUG10_20565 (plasmid) [Halorarum halophilum]|uniref:Uncharacterized protein n=1 Tax=Halorarum halophilum TaxID=2743090 RepID=A0A7D5KQ09_9EURY|nr:hypothetical protein [Halobaculum halophilum]QLG30002.1 hypothetical protein HUG10_20565 [Halobaculum halophilum]
MSYDFIDDNARPDNYTYGHEVHDPSWWGLGTHREDDGTDWDAVLEDVEDVVADVPGMNNLLNEAERIADSYRDFGFECPVCGLRHGHSSDKHDVRDFFAVTEEFVDKMHKSPYCHCGVHELARLLNYFRSIEIQVFEDQDEDGFDIDSRKRQVKSAAGSAPIPDRVRNELDDQLGPA